MKVLLAYLLMRARARAKPVQGKQDGWQSNDRSFDDQIMKATKDRELIPSLLLALIAE